MDFSVIKIIKWIFTRTIVFYLVFFLLIWKILDYRQFIGNAIPQALSRLTPPIDYFKEFVDQNDNYNRFDLMDCIVYHQAVSEFFVYQKAEAFGMLGFCQERLGDQSKAIDDYKQSIALNPDYFWPYYNLGVLYYKQSHFDLAAEYFKQAIIQNPMKTIVLLARSKVYSDVKLSQLNGVYDYLQSLKEGRLTAYILLMDSLNKQGLFPQLELVAINGLKEDLGRQGVFFYYLSICLHMQGKEAAAQALLAKAQFLQQTEGSIDEFFKPRVQFF